LLWEDLPLGANTSFQEGIDLLLSGDGVDVAVFILWSRLGSPLGPKILREDGSEYRSGTEREWDLMLQAQKKSQLDGTVIRPFVIAYARTDEVSFEERLRGETDEDKSKKINQKLLVNQFIKEEFRDDETGTNIRAYHSFDQPTSFARQLRIHLTNFLDTAIESFEAQAIWNIADQGPPFRGLSVFEFEHSPIFFGREDEIVAIRAQLREQAKNGCPFVLISGASGSGKSSLARAGLLPDICSFEIDSAVRRWRRLAIKPNQLGPTPAFGLVNALMSPQAIPELETWRMDIDYSEAKDNFESWLTRFSMRVSDALKSAGEKQGTTRLVLLLDQMEELFSDQSVTSKAINQLFETLETLARSGQIWILATVRGDFYHHCQAVPAVVRMKAGFGQFDLLSPTPDSLNRIITGPAMLAGLRFERENDVDLSDVILREAAAHEELLPLVEHLLLELFQNRTEDGVLTFAKFREVGGVEGALLRHCEQAFISLTPAAQDVFDDVLGELVTVSGEGQGSSVRRSIPLSRFENVPAQWEIIEKFVAARLLTTSLGPSAESAINVSHEALLRVWPRIVDWMSKKY
jgi:hypothetical protein